MAAKFDSAETRWKLLALGADYGYERVLHALVSYLTPEQCRRFEARLGLRIDMEKWMPTQPAQTDDHLLFTDG